MCIQCHTTVVCHTQSTGNSSYAHKHIHTAATGLELLIGVHESFAHDTFHHQDIPHDLNKFGEY